MEQTVQMMIFYCNLSLGQVSNSVLRSMRRALSIVCKQLQTKQMKGNQQRCVDNKQESGHVAYNHSQWQ